MKTTLIDFFDTFPVTSESVALSMNVSRQWIHYVVTDKSTAREELRRRGVLQIQDHIQQKGDQLIDVRITRKNIHQVLPETPFALRKLSKMINMPVDSVQKLIETSPEKRNPDTILALQEVIQQTAKKMSMVVFTDYLEHDEVARLLLPMKGKFNGIIV